MANDVTRRELHEAQFGRLMWRIVSLMLIVVLGFTIGISRDVIRKLKIGYHVEAQQIEEASLALTFQERLDSIDRPDIPFTKSEKEIEALHKEAQKAIVEADAKKIDIAIALNKLREIEEGLDKIKLKKYGWISSADRVPNIGDEVLLFSSSRRYYMAIYKSNDCGKHEAHWLHPTGIDRTSESRSPKGEVFYWTKDYKNFPEKEIQKSKDFTKHKKEDWGDKEYLKAKKREAKEKKGEETTGDHWEKNHRKCKNKNHDHAYNRRRAKYTYGHSRSS